MLDSGSSRPISHCGAIPAPCPTELRSPTPVGPAVSHPLRSLRTRGSTTTAEPCWFCLRHYGTDIGPALHKKSPQLMGRDLRSSGPLAKPRAPVHEHSYVIPHKHITPFHVVSCCIFGPFNALKTQIYHAYYYCLRISRKPPISCVVGTYCLCAQAARPYDYIYIYCAIFLFRSASDTAEWPFPSHLLSPLLPHVDQQQASNIYETRYDS